MLTTLKLGLLIANLTLCCHGTQGVFHQGTINKCCPLHQRFKYDHGAFECVLPGGDDVDGGVEEDWWRMAEEGLLLINGSTDNSWLADVRVVEDRRPRCGPGSSDVLLLSETEREFTLSVGEDDGVTLQVLKESARHDPAVDNEALYHGEDFCIDLTASTAMYVAILCPCRAVPCVRKCCMDTEAYNQTSRTCQHVDDFPYQVYDWVPGVYNDTKENVMDYYRLTQKVPDCHPKSVHVIPHRLYEEAKLILLADGSIQAADTGRIYPVDTYCGDFTVDNDEMVYYCLDSDAALPSDVVLHVYGAIFLLSAAALVITVVLTLFISHMRDSLFTLMALLHNAMLMVGFTATGVTQLAGHHLADTTCNYISFVIQFSIIASFFWMNAMCIDISWIFSGLQQVRSIYQPSCRLRFLVYSVYAWGSTGLISIATLVAQYTPGHSSWRPNFGEETCFFNNLNATWLFFYGPMAVLLSVNVVLLTLTTWRMRTSYRRHTMLDDEEDARVTHRRKLVLFLKVFILLSATWIFEVLSWAVDGNSAFWIFTDVVNLFRGVVIFVIFCANKAVYTSVRDGVRQLWWRRRGSVTGGYCKSTTGKSLELDEIVNEE